MKRTVENSKHYWGSSSRKGATKNKYVIVLKLGEWYLSKLMFRSVFILGILLRARKSDYELKDMRKIRFNNAAEENDLSYSVTVVAIIEVVKVEVWRCK